jgi:F-type H+-transporting ATPase subunit a
MFIGGLQAFIFALLTVIYFAMAGAGHDDHEDTTPEQDEDLAARPELAA